MKKTLLLFLAMLLLMGARTAADAQELTVSDIEFINNGYYDEHPMIILTKEGSALNVHLMNYPAHPYTEEFVITPKMSGGNDGEPCSVSIGVSYINNSETAIITTFNVSFNVHDIEANSFYFSCWWYKGMVSLTEGEPLELWENKKISKDGVIYVLDNKTKTATLSSGRYVEGEYNIPSELDYGGQTFTLTSIEYPAFADNSSLTSVIIPKSVTNIGAAAFYRCSNLTDLYCYAENVPTTGINVFTETPIASATLHVPAGSVEKYKTTSPWSEFGNIVEMTTSRKILPFVQDGKVWSYKAKRLLASPEYQAEWDEIYSLEGDTVIDSHQCLKLYLTSNCPDKYLPIDYPYTGALYEDGKKVYYIAPNSTTPALLYDFSCESGTIVKVNNFELGINERKLVKYRGEYLTVIAWTPIELDEPDAYTYGNQYYWIEGIGSEIDLMNATPVWYDGGISKYLVTCKLNGQIIYDKDDFLTSAQIVTEAPVTFTKDQIATIILPTEPDASKGKYYRLDRCEDNQIIFEQELQPRARVPYIIVPAEDFSIDPNALNLEGLHSDTVSIEGVSFIGSYVREELPALTGEDGVESSYIDFIDTTPDCGPSISAETGKESLLIGTLRAYLIVKWDDPIDHGSPSVPPFGKKEIVLKDFKTEINSLTPDPSPRRGEVFDLQGRRIDNSKLPRGIYIKDGKKVVVCPISR
ncbi:MAG: leucine-rich repeat domain-containing protein [Bacteroidaceae bacterium]|nr:leucine-rich repeat domain-containing protein [Bacteroidaceae bacterium]